MLALLRALLPAVLIAVPLCTASAAEATPDNRLYVGFGEADITPDLSARRGVWLAGFLPHRQATAVHDPLRARAVVLRSGTTSIALVSVDLLGLMRPDVQRVRAAVADLDDVIVASTHNHSAPDTIGLWAPTPFLTGADPAYLDRVVEQCAAAVRRAQQAMHPAVLRFGTASEVRLLADHRQPEVYDPTLRVLAFHSPTDEAAGRSRGRLLGSVVIWNCHPEALGAANTQVTADFPATTVEVLKRRHGGDVVYFTGAVGGLMAPPGGRFVDERGQPLRSDGFRFAEAYGRRVADLADRALRQSQPVAGTRIRVARVKPYVPMRNSVYRIGRQLGLVRREAWEWTGDPWQRGAEWERGAGWERGKATNGANRRAAAGGGNLLTPRLPAIETEVAVVQIGSLHLACIPGEIYPELVYGQFQEPVDLAADFPRAPTEPSVAEMLDSRTWAVLGLAGDEIGYLIPKRQWDARPPYAYQLERAQYGEINSVGYDAAAIIMQGLQRCVQQLEDP